MPLAFRWEIWNFKTFPNPWRIHGCLVYLPTWMVDFNGKCREIYHTWIVWERLMKDSIYRIYALRILTPQRPGYFEDQNTPASYRFIHPSNSRVQLSLGWKKKKVWIYLPRKSKDQTLPSGSRESFTWIILKTILCLVLDFQGLPSFWVLFGVNNASQ